MTSLLSILDENSLLQVLLRTRCEDHRALRQTCRRFQSIIDSKLFSQQRAQQEWAQVETHLLTAQENCKKTRPEEYDPEDEEFAAALRKEYCELGWKRHFGGRIENEFRVLVDGKVGGYGHFILIKRNKHFYSSCDIEPWNAASRGLRDTGCLFFDKKGRPRLPSLKNAMILSTSTNNTNDSSTGSSLQKDYFLYLDTFKLNPEYQQNAMYVGAKAIRSLLLDSPLQNKWSIVIYIANVTTHQTEHDELCARKQERYEQHLFYASAVIRQDRKEEDEQALQESNDWKERLRSLAKVDLYQFIRCGFQQTMDSFQKRPSLYVMAVPAFLNRPILSHEEASAVNIVDRKDMSPGNLKSVIDSELSSFMSQSCIMRLNLFETILRKQSTPLPTREQVAGLFDSQVDELQRKIDAAEQKAEQTNQLNVVAREELDGERRRIQELKSLTSQFNAPIESLAEARRRAYHKLIGEMQQLEFSVESKSAHLKESISLNEKCLRTIAETKESLESLQSRKNEVIEDEMRLQLSAHAQKLTKARADLTRHDMAVKAEVAKLVGRINSYDGTAASVKNSDALHECARYMIPEYIDLLLELTPPAERRCALNKFDGSYGSGLTPIMAVAGARYLPSNPQGRIEMAEKLIALGADKNITDVFGETALGKFRTMRLDSGEANFGGTSLFVWGQQRRTQVVLERERMRMEQVLRPIGGPTAADDSYLNNVSDDDDDDDSDDDNDEVESVTAEEGHGG